MLIWNVRGHDRDVRPEISLQGVVREYCRFVLNRRGSGEGCHRKEPTRLPEKRYGRG